MNTLIYAAAVSMLALLIYVGGPSVCESIAPVANLMMSENFPFICTTDPDRSSPNEPVTPVEQDKAL
jgi:hypothetical protein